jgi:ketosteroid isomerase-like protein
LFAQASTSEEVRRAETAFAATMAAGDFAAFATHIADEAVFFGRSGPLRGKAAVLEATPPFSWQPEIVEVLESGTHALSCGPVRDPSGTLIGTFSSVWRRGPDGRWLVVFDRGCPAPSQ